MSHLRHNLQAGFTLIELLIVMFIIGVASTTFVTFFDTSISQFLTLDRDSLAFSNLATQSQRVGNVIRGLTDINQASNNELTIYTYFAPDDTYVSLTHYYLNVSKTKMFADVTPMTANPPIGTPISGALKTFTIIDSFYLPTNLNTFNYYDASNTLLTPPIADLHTIKSIKVNLAVPSKSPVATSSTTMSVEVSLRNRKTNL